MTDGQAAAGVMLEFVRAFFSRRFRHVRVEDETVSIGLFPEHRYEAVVMATTNDFRAWIDECATPAGRSWLLERAPTQMQEAVAALADKVLSLLRDDERIAATDTRLSAHACRLDELASVYDEYSGVVATVFEERDHCHRVCLSLAWSHYRRPEEIPLDARFEGGTIPLHVWTEILTEARDGPHKERK